MHAVVSASDEPAILIAHSAGCLTVRFWSQEHTGPVVGALPRCVRVLLHVIAPEGAARTVKHVYLRNAAGLRQDQDGRDDQETVR